jgi:uncharacterized lipoprotein YmbA
MMKRYLCQIKVILLGAILTALAGCAGTSPPSNFYVLNSLPESPAAKQPAGDENKLSIGIGPVTLPDYLNRSQIVTRVSPNELKVAAFDRWAEPLESSFPRILTENLAALLNTNQIVIFPWRQFVPFEYQVAVDVVRFDAEAEGKAVLITRWAIIAANRETILMQRKSTFEAPLKSQSYSSIVSAQSQTMIDFSHEIAAAIKTISQEAAPR